MTTYNNFNPVVVAGTSYPISHLCNLNIELSIEFSNGDERAINVHMRPTNHLYSRKAESEDYAQKNTLDSVGAWLRSYVHRLGNYQAVDTANLQLKEERVFCYQKWEQSKHFPLFVEHVSSSPSQVSVLANPGDDKTCLSALISLENEEDKVYLVFFHLHKVNSKEINMLIESAFLVLKEESKKAQKLIKPKDKEGMPFILIVKNVLEGRKPFENLKRSGSSYKRKKKKNKNKT
jgi:hypothetical protein